MKVDYEPTLDVHGWFDESQIEQWFDEILVASSSGAGSTGTVAVTLADFTSSASGNVTISGTSAQTLAGFTSTASGKVTVTGSAAVTIADFTSAAAGSVTVTGTIPVTLANFTSSATGNVSIPGSAAVTLEVFVGLASGTVAPDGTVAAILDAFTMTSTPTVTAVTTGTNGYTWSLSGTTATSVSWSNDRPAQTILVNHHASTPLYVRWDGAAAVNEAEGCIIVPPGYRFEAIIAMGATISVVGNSNKVTAIKKGPVLSISQNRPE